MQQQTPQPETFDFAAMVADLNSLLRLKTTVIGMKMFAAASEMAAIPKIRRPTAIHTTDQIVSMASRLGWTVGITADDLVGAQCRAVIGLAPQDDKWLAGENSGMAPPKTPPNANRLWMSFRTAATRRWWSVRLRAGGSIRPTFVWSTQRPGR
jgi:hypothetical protein